jgi:hypothetical protein
MPISFGDWIKYASGKGTITPQGTFQANANPNDPNQVANWALGIASQNVNRPLYDAQTFNQLQSLFQPYYASQVAGLTNQMNVERGRAGQQAGATAYAQGFANPGAYGQGAQQRVTETYAPLFQQMQSGFLGNLLGATGQSNQFQSSNIDRLLNTYMQRANIAQQQQMINQQPTLLDYLAGGLMGGIGAIGQGFGYNLGRGI